MAAFLIAFNKINDPEVFAEYIKAAGAASIPELKLRGVMNPCEIMDGDLPYPRCVILEFPDADTAREWYDSPAYQAARPKRFAASEGFVVLVEGGDTVS